MVSDLFSADALYHVDCDKRFQNFRASANGTKRKMEHLEGNEFGKDMLKQDSFLDVCEIGSNETMKDILPDSLIVFLDQLFSYRNSNSNLDVKKLSIGQAINSMCLSFATCIQSHRT